MNEYNGWPLLESIPEGWRIDKTAGSPLFGYQFITNGKSVINGQERALLKVAKSADTGPINHQPSSQHYLPDEHKAAKILVLDAACARTVNQLARERFKEKLMKDILVDLTICEIEGWSKTEYINELKVLVNSIGNHTDSEVVFSKTETTTQEVLPL